MARNKVEEKAGGENVGNWQDFTLRIYTDANDRPIASLIFADGELSVAVPIHPVLFKVALNARDHLMRVHKLKTKALSDVNACRQIAH
jgi:hypothetical protein